ncbi:MAG: nitroreductase family protein [Sedimentisphaerales bacterium]|nr:nitroreductase family protein [Sedimentisphaerales bacterium]
MIELLRQRRSVRKFAGQAVEPEKVKVLTEALLRSPSSRGFNPWDFIFVQDKSILSELAGAKESGSSFIKDAALAVVVCGDQSKSDVWVEDCSIASIILQLTAQSLGLGSCWVQIHKRMHSSDMTSNHYLKEVLGLPDNIAVESIIAIGYPAEEPEPIKYDFLDFDKIHTEKWEEK